jgi:hypothetical protein
MMKLSVSWPTSQTIVVVHAHSIRPFNGSENIYASRLAAEMHETNERFIEAEVSRADLICQYQENNSQLHDNWPGRQLLALMTHQRKN